MTKKAQFFGCVCVVLSVVMFEQTNVLLGSSLGSESGLPKKQKKVTPVYSDKSRTPQSG